MQDKFRSQQTRLTSIKSDGSYLHPEEMALADGAGRPRVIWMAVEFQELWDVDNASESCSLNLLVKQMWRCPQGDAEQAFEQGGDAEGLGQRGIGLNSDWMPDWQPRLKLWHLTAELVERRSRYVAVRPKDEGDPTAVWIIRWTDITCKINQEYNLMPFPFDVQSVRVRIGIDNVEQLRPLSDDVRVAAVRANLDGVSKLPEFSMLPDPQPGAVYKFLRNELIVAFNYERLWPYHLYNVYCLCALITLCCVPVWAVDPEAAVEGRLGIGVTLLLVAIAFKQAVSNLLPPVSYLTIMDYYVLISIIFVVLAILCHASVGALLRLGTRTDAMIREWDAILLIGWTCSWLAWNMMYGIYVREQLKHNNRRFDWKGILARGFQAAEISNEQIVDRRAAARSGKKMDVDDPRSQFGSDAPPVRLNAVGVLCSALSVMPGCSKWPWDTDPRSSEQAAIGNKPKVVTPDPSSYTQLAC